MTDSEGSPVNKSLPAEKEYLQSEIPGERTGGGVWGKRLKSFPALQNKNYRFYFAGQFISVIGTWLQIVAEGWLVLQLSNSPFLIGVVAALATIPALLFSLFGGVIVDRFPKQKILFLTQFSAMILALILGTLTILNQVTIPIIGTLAFLLGTVNAIDGPARLSFVSELVTKDQLPSAIALNSAIYNTGRVVGPGVAGLLIALAGTGGAFILNGISYLAIILVLASLKIKGHVPLKSLNPIQAIKDGLNYSFTHPIIRVLLLFTAVISIFGWSYATMMPVIAKNTFHLGAKGLGYLYSATGVGSLLATYLIGAHARKIPATVFIIGGNILFSVSLILFVQTSNFYIALALLFFTGLGLLSQAAMMNTIIQGMVKNEFRGRVMSLYILMFLGLAPLGNFEIGWLTENFGIAVAITLNALIVFAVGMVLLAYRGSIRDAYLSYKESEERSPEVGKSESPKPI